MYVSLQKFTPAVARQILDQLFFKILNLLPEHWPVIRREGTTKLVCVKLTQKNAFVIHNNLGKITRTSTECRMSKSCFIY